MIVEYLLTTLSPRLNELIVGDGIRPALFELYMLHKMKTISKPASRHVIRAILTQIAKSMKYLSIHDGVVAYTEAVGEIYADHIYWAALALLDSYSFIYKGMSFFENVQGYSRISTYCPYYLRDDIPSQSVQPVDNSFSKLQRIFSILYCVILPRIVSVLDNWCTDWRSIEVHLKDKITCESYSISQKHVTARVLQYIRVLRSYIFNKLKWLLRLMKAGFGHSFPYLKALYSSLAILIRLLYVSRRTDFHDPITALLGVKLIKSTTNSTNPTQQKVFNMSYTAVLLLFTRLLQWHANNDLSAQNISQLCRTEPPVKIPFPAAPLSGPGCLLLPPTRDICAICRGPRVNPCAASSGYVFCYNCILPIVRSTQKCPVTHLPCTDQQLIRLFENDS